MEQKKGMSTVQKAQALIEPVLEELGLSLWDVRFEKEGATWYLRYLLDKDGGIEIKDLEKASGAVSRLLDETDPIPQSYVLEVSSPGAERQLTRDWHYEDCMGARVQVRLIRPVDGVRDFTGILSAAEGDNVTILLGDEESQDEMTEMTFTKKESAYVKLYVDFEIGGFKG